MIKIFLEKICRTQHDVIVKNLKKIFCAISQRISSILLDGLNIFATQKFYTLCPRCSVKLRYHWPNKQVFDVTVCAWVTWVTMSSTFINLFHQRLIGPNPAAEFFKASNANGSSIWRSRRVAKKKNDNFRNYMRRQLHA